MELPSLPQFPSSVSESWDYVSKKISSFFIDKADSDNKCAHKSDYDIDEESDEEVVCRCFENFDSLEVEDPCPYL